MQKKLLLSPPELSDTAIAVLVVLILCFIAGAFQSGWLYAVVAFLTALLCINLIASCIILSSLEFQICHEMLIKTGQTAEITVSLKNSSKHYLYHYCFAISADENFDIVRPLPQIGDQDEILVKASDSAEADSDPPCQFVKFHLHRLAPNEERTFSYAVKAKKRGCHQIKFQTRSVNFPLGLFAVFKQDEFQKPIWVYPAPIKTSFQKHPKSELGNLRTVKLRSADGDLRGLREYSEGEDIRYIHWMTSARFGKPIIKEFQEVRSSQNILIIPIADYSLLKQLYPKQFSRWERRSEKENIFVLLTKLLLSIYINFESIEDIEKSLSSYFGFEELMCCLITAAEKYSGGKDSFTVVFQNSEKKLQTLSNLEKLKHKAAEWSMLSGDFCFENEEQKQSFYHSLELMLKKRSFSRIIVLSLSQEALPIPCLQKYKSKTSYLLFTPLYCDGPNSGGSLEFAGSLPELRLKRTIYDAFSQKLSELKALSKTAELITPNSSPQNTAKLL